jgi:hypothetical protein
MSGQLSAISSRISDTSGSIGWIVTGFQWAVQYQMLRTGFFVCCWLTAEG